MQTSIQITFKHLAFCAGEVLEAPIAFIKASVSVSSSIVHSSYHHLEARELPVVEKDDEMTSFMMKKSFSNDPNLCLSVWKY